MGGGSVEQGPGRSGPRPPDASMSLLNELLRAPLDPGYAAAAQRRRVRAERAAAGRPVPARSAGVRAGIRVGMLAASVLLGLVLAAAIVNLRVPAAASAQARESLVTRIDVANAGLAERSAAVDGLRADITALQAGAGDDARPAAARAAALGLQAGTVALTGPGVVVTLDDAPASPLDGQVDAQARGGQFAPGRIVARDLQAVVNATWAAGAEAVAVNGHRLTATSAIRFAGQAILVNYRPLTRPYVVTALGAPDLGERFESGAGGAYLRELTAAYQAPTQVRASDRLSVPVGTALSLRYARPAAGAGPTPDRDPTQDPTRDPTRHATQEARP